MFLFNAKKNSKVSHFYANTKSMVYNISVLKKVLEKEFLRKLKIGVTFTCNYQNHII